MTTATRHTFYAEGQLSALLKSETAQAHHDAENSVFMTQLLDGKLDINAVAALTGQLYFVYEALESAVRANQDTAELAPIYDPRLERLSALESDLEQLYGGQWREHIAPLPATQNYVEALRQIGAEQDGAAALAHHYVRYLGDMSGGQVIARMFEKYYGLDERSTSFYDFDAIGRIKPYRDRYRITLNQLELGAEDKEKIIDCASTAFAMNQAVFQALAEQHVR